ncbi:MAG: cation transporter [Anaerolineae bacterium]|nr:cation transporter [Anaerolineae bacterium]
MTTQLASTQELTLAIRGMTCAGCAASIQQALSELPGVSDAVVQLSAKQAQVTFDPAQVGLPQLVEAVAKAGYTAEQALPAPPPSAPQEAAALRHALRQAQEGPQDAAQAWRRPLLFSLLGMAGLMILYLAIVSLAEGWTHAVELMIGDAWLVGPIMVGFGVQVGLYTYLKTAIHAATQGAGALTGAGGGTSTAAMVACCAHHVADVLPLLGLSAAATFLADYRIPFMLVGLATNLIGIGVISFLILRQRRHLAECALKAQPAPSAPACH